MFVNIYLLIAVILCGISLHDEPQVPGGSVPASDSLVTPNSAGADRHFNITVADDEEGTECMVLQPPSYFKHPEEAAVTPMPDSVTIPEDPVPKNVTFLGPVCRDPLCSNTYVLFEEGHDFHIWQIAGNAFSKATDLTDHLERSAFQFWVLVLLGWTLTLLCVQIYQIVFKIFFGPTCHALGIFYRLLLHPILLSFRCLGRAIGRLLRKMVSFVRGPRCRLICSRDYRGDRRLCVVRRRRWYKPLMELW